MLIGGMDVLGVYCIDSTPALAKQVRIKKQKFTMNSIKNLKAISFQCHLSRY
jgi:hypothetical protein